MSSFPATVIAQFKRPTGALGRLAGLIMASRPSNKKRNQWTLDLLNIQPADQIFELGCGPGYALALAAAKTTRGFVTGVDHSTVMTEMSRRRLRAAIRDDRANIILGGGEQLRVFDRTLNAIYCANVIQFLDDKHGYFTLAYDALACGGRIATTYQPRGHNPTAAKADAIAKECSTAMEKTGFSSIRIERLDGDKIPTICILGQR